MKKVVFALAALGATTGAVGLAASPVSAETMPSETIETAAYNLSTTGGYEAVAGQIRRAAGRVCGSVDLRNLDSAPEWYACRSATIADAMDQLNTVSRQGSVTITATH